MNKEILSDRQGIAVISLFIMGSSLVLTTGGASKKDVWLAIILSFCLSLPIVFLHARLQSIFPQKDLYDVLELVFGTYIGKGISFIFILFSFILAALILRAFGDFIFTVALVETPIIIHSCVAGILCIWAVKEGIEIIGRIGEFFLIPIIFLVLFLCLTLFSKMDINHLRPFLEGGTKPLVTGIFQSFIFPFTQTILFTTFSSFKRKSIYKVYTCGLLIGFMVIYIVSLTNILVLGNTLSTSAYFPTYLTSSLIKIKVKSVFSGFEIIITAALFIGGFIKVSICLLSTCNGFAKLFRLSDYKPLVTPIGLLLINLTYFIHDSVMEKSEFALDVYPTYALPFQVILPIFILVFAEARKKQILNKLKKQELLEE